MGKNNSTLWDVIVLGGGASGCMAAISAAENQTRVLILEHKDKIGKKILATGNGKCNFTNADIRGQYYRGNTELAMDVIARFGKEDTLAFFREIGVYPFCKNGYYYPYSQTAASVVEALSGELDRRGVRVECSVTISAIEHTKYGFCLMAGNKRYQCRKLILATGLLASPKLGSDGSALDLIKSLGHRFTPIVPALCAFYADGFAFRQAAGVRTDAKVTLYVEKKKVAEDSGEIQLTDYGVSGIPVFQISRFASRSLYEKKKVTLTMDFCPIMEEETLREELTRRLKKGNISLLQILNGLFPNKLIHAIIAYAQLDHKTLATDLKKEELQRLIQSIKCCEVTLDKPREYEFAQVCAGGIRSNEIDRHTLASAIVPGLYFCGELLDVDGICGGYNLQWAWSSGKVAGESAAVDLRLG